MMKRNTIKWRIFKYNILAITALIAITAIVFNIAVRVYIKSDITRQLDAIALNTEETALQQGPGFFPPMNGKNGPMSRRMGGGMGNGMHGNPGNTQASSGQNNGLLRFYFMLDRSLRESLSVLNADYILLDNSKEAVLSPQDQYFTPPSAVLDKVREEITQLGDEQDKKNVKFNLSGTGYIAVVMPVSGKNTFGLGWIVIYSSLQKLDQLQLGINLILFSILLLSGIIFALFSSLAAKKISQPFTSLNQHIRAIAERNFSKKLQIPVDDELKEFISNINTMSEKLETYDKAQKTFLQNASHEFRTPLMSIQSYAEGIKYDVVEKNPAAEIIIDETKRMTGMVEDLLYLSRLDTIEENYHFERLSLSSLINSCIDRINGIAVKNNIAIGRDSVPDDLALNGDEEMLTRAITNILGNCIRYAKSEVQIKAGRIDSSKSLYIEISDNGPGFDENEVPSIFERFYKGKKGNTGLGLAIAKNVVEKHSGTITAENKGTGALFTITLPSSH